MNGKPVDRFVPCIVCHVLELSNMEHGGKRCLPKAESIQIDIIISILGCVTHAPMQRVMKELSSSFSFQSAV